jgi:hypothetical protein
MLRACTTQSIELSLGGKMKKKSQQRPLCRELVSTLIIMKNKTHDAFIKRQTIILHNLLVVSSAWKVVRQAQGCAYPCKSNFVKSDF